ncbi:MAG: hypothetical protein PVJ86_10360, partial [Phycisphaerales bacterium]
GSPAYKQKNGEEWLIVYILAEFIKSFRTFNKTLRGRPRDLTLSIPRPSYTELNDVFCSFSGVL